MGVAYTYAPNAELSVIVMAGVPLAIIALLVTSFELTRTKNIGIFVGYPIDYSSLWLFLLLAICVFGARYWDPKFPILTLITFISPSITVLVLVAKRDKIFKKLRAHSRERLPTMGNELALFLAAGVFSYGLQLVLLDNNDWLPFTIFGPNEAAFSLGAALLAALLGFHPIITIAVMDPYYYRSTLTTVC
jgi:Ca2+/Na+ antiporter